MEKLELKGTQQFLGMDIPIMEGGFGKNQRVMLAKDIAILHNVQLFNLNKLINNNINRFGLYDLIDLKTYSSEESVLIQNNLFTKAQYGNAKNIYLLSERGYTKLVSMMDNKNDKKWEVMDKLIDEYFTMRQIINSSEQMKAQLLLSIYNGGQEGVEASKKLTELEKKPLLDTIEEQKPKVEYHDSVLNPTDIKKLVTATAIAKDIGTTAKKLNEVLHNLGIQYKQSNAWYVTAPYAYLMTNGYADYVVNKYGQNLKWSEKGRKFIIDLLKNNNHLDSNGMFK